MSNNNSNFSEAEEVEIVNIGREGISYRELKILHSLSMQTSNNLSRILMTTTTTSSSTSLSSLSSSSLSSSLLSSSSSTIMPTLFLSKNVKILMTNRNFLIPFSSFKE